MKKKVYSKVLVLTSLFAVGAAGLASVMAAKENKDPITAKAEEATFIEWKGCFTSGWNPNPTDLSAGYATYLVELCEKFTKVDGNNLRDVTGSGDQITFNGTVITGMSGVEFSHANDGRYVKFKIPKASVVAAEGKDYFEIHVNEGTLFDGHKLRELTIHINPETYEPTIAYCKSINTNVTGINPFQYSSGWFRIDLEGYPLTKSDDTFTVYNYGLNFANKIYVNGDSSKLLLTPGKASYSMTMNVGGGNGLSFNSKELTTALADISSVTIPAGTEFPGRTGQLSASYSDYYVTQKDQTFVRYGDAFFEEVETNVTGYYPRVWGANQRAFVLEGFTDASESGGDKTNRPFNYSTNIYINKDKNQPLYTQGNRDNPYFEMSHSHTFGSTYCTDFDSSPERYVTIPAGTQFPDSKAWKGEIGGKVFVTKDDVTYARSADGNFRKYTDVKEVANFGTLSLEGFNGTAADVVCSGAGQTNFPINKYSPFGDKSIHFAFKVNNESGNNFSSNTLINAKSENKVVSGGYKFNFARGYGKILYGSEDIGPTSYFTYTDDVDYRVDMYIIKVDASHVRLVMLMDGFALVDQLRDCSSDIIGDLTQMSVYTTTAGTTTIKNIDVDAEAVDLFCEKALKMSEPGATAADNYVNAKNYVLNYLTAKQRELFYTSSTYASAVARLEAWAQENSEHAVVNANFSAVHSYWNNRDIAGEEGMKRTYLEFDAKPFSSYSSANIAGSKVFINGVSSSTISDFKMFCNDPSGNFVMMDYPATMLTTTKEYPYTCFHADAGIVTPEAYPWTTLGEINMYLNASGQWVKVSGIHTVTLTDAKGTETMYIPDGATVPARDLSKFCSATYKVGGEVFDIKTPITADTAITLETTEHDYEHHDEVASTCVQTGTKEHYTCKNCDKLFVKNGDEYEVVTSASLVLPLASHTPTALGGQASSCTEHGFKVYYKCTVCNAYFEDKDCTKSITDLEAWKAGAGQLPLKDHTIDPESVKFTFAADGKSATATYACTECGKTYDVASSDINIASEVTKDPTCTEKGETTYTATWKTYSDTKTVADVPATGHDPASVEKVNGQAPTCTVPGFKDAYYCNDCELYYVDSAMTKLIGDEAEYEAWKVGEGQLTKDHTLSKHDEVAATCCETGSKEYYECSECHQFFEDELGETLIGNDQELATWLADENGGLLPIDPDNHEDGLTKHDAAEPTCSKVGNIEYYSCEDCGKYFIEVEGEMVAVSLDEVIIPIDPNNHDLEYVAEVAATYSADGVKAHYVCNDCGKLFIKEGDVYVEKTEADLVIPKLENKVVEIVSISYDKSVNVGETVNAADVTLVVKYSDGTTATVKAESVTCDTSKAGTAIATAKYGGLSKTFNVEVKAAATKKGCGGSVIAASAIVAGLAIAGAGLIAAKKRKEEK